jgi:hypothetical protein
MDGKRRSSIFERSNGRYGFEETGGGSTYTCCSTG